MDGKLFGVGLKNALMLAIFTMLIIVMSKVVFNKYNVPGVSTVVNAV